MKVKELWRKSVCTIKESGFRVFLKKVKYYLEKVRRLEENSVAAPSAEGMFMDVLFINGCYLPHPSRYRVSHQREQLLANGMNSSEVFYEDLSLDLVKYYRLFIFFRCPYTDMVGNFITLAKKHHKVVLFDIDDLVIDRKYTDQIPYIKQMPKTEKEGYDSGVDRMQKTLRLCHGAITTTERLAEELRRYVPEVYINRNVANDRMVELSRWAVFDRDVVPTLPLDQVETQRERRRIEKLKREAQEKAERGCVAIGYFSGSITHNDDIRLMLPCLVEIMQQYQNVELHIVGELDIPEELEPFRTRVKTRPFVSWEELPRLIASVDINIAPLERTIFNEAKSENKWVEAALVKVPTVASRVGAFEKKIEHNVTGILCETREEWTQALKKLVEDPEYRRKIGNAACQYAHENCCTLRTGYPITKFLRNCMTENVMMVLPSLQISGGVLVALKHCQFLKSAGLDVTILNDGFENQNIKYAGEDYFVLSTKQDQIHGRIDKAVATLWTTVNFLAFYPNIESRYYLVQNMETNFYQPGQYIQFTANQTYNAVFPLKYITISKWCQAWLKSDFEKDAKYAPNGLELSNFPNHKRRLAVHNRKVRILIEGNSDDYYKNVDESFRIDRKSVV